ncbi:MAG TPA: hypothetical protein IGR64_17035, partial [Leptolyngbyaceae cyanobacterium M65_K2018_010]|nr:hypothetical protein [Leptolyngbyaceae cyanobacterium M65_K2018_010]
MAFSSPSIDFSLASLSQALSARVTALGLGADLQVDCWARAGYLIVIGQHLAPEARDPDQVLTDLQGLLADLMPHWDWADSPWADSSVVPVRLYLKLKTAPRPYALGSFDWRPEGDGRGPSDPDSPLLDSASELGLWEEGQVLTAPESAGDQSLALPETAIQPPAPSLWAKQGRQLVDQTGQFLRHYWGFGVAGLILLGSGIFAYALTRPCVVGSCDRLGKADEYYQIAEATLKAQPNCTAVKKSG